MISQYLWRNPMKPGSLNMNQLHDDLTGPYRAALKSLETAKAQDSLSHRHDLIGDLRDRAWLDRRTGWIRREADAERLYVAEEWRGLWCFLAGLGLGGVCVFGVLVAIGWGPL